jgi:HlyD family secretion protein
MSALLKPVPPAGAEGASETVGEAFAPRPPLEVFTSAEPALDGGFLRLRPRLIVVGAAVVVALALAGYGVSRLVQHKPVAAALPPSQTITIGTVVKGPMIRTLVVNGSLAPWEELPIGAETGGWAIVEVAVDEGDRVQKGQLLARLDDSVLKAQVAQADAAIGQADAQLRKAEAMAATAGSDAKRAHELSRNGYMSGQMAEQRETTLTTAAADVNVARQNLEAAKAVKAEREAQLAHTEIRAPTDGIIAKRMAYLGNVVEVGQQLFHIVRDNRIELRAEVPEIDLPRLRAGQKATITLGDADARRVEGHIRLVGATVDPQTRIGIVYVALPDDQVLKPGMFVRGVIETGSGDVLQVPEEALVYKDGKPAVFVVGDDSRTRLRMVELGDRQGGSVEILNGLEAGDHVALAGAGYLKDNDLVRVEQALPVSEAGRPDAGVVR